MIADEDDLTWKFTTKFDNLESVDICTTHASDEEYIVLLSNDEFPVQDVPELIKALQAAYDFHMEHKED